MIYCNKRSLDKVVHIKKCFYIKNKCLKEVIVFTDLKEALQKGYRLCKNCNPLKRRYLEEEKEVLSLANKNNLKLNFCDTELRVQSPVEQWKIVVSRDGNGISLYHNNTENRYFDNYVPYYHLQDVVRDKITDYLKYILNHATYIENVAYKEIYNSKKKNFKHSKTKKVKKTQSNQNV